MKMKNIIRKLLNKIAFKIGIILVSSEAKIASATLPNFGNTPRNLKIDFPRRIQNPENIFIGDDVSIGPGSLLKTVTHYPANVSYAKEAGYPIQEFSPRLEIGDRVSATASLQISALNSIIIENDVMFASNIFICDGLHGYDKADTPFKYQPMTRISPITIKQGCWIGQNVVILPGVTIGEFSIIGANSVVTRDIPSRSIAVGSPARVGKKWDEDTSMWRVVSSEMNDTK
jgi:acetyltransferase-like isoleucine patch superfamily enzyme